MVTKSHIEAAQMARRLSDLVKEEHAAKQLWFRQFGAVSEIWLIADAEDLATERRLRSLGLELYQEFPNRLIDFQLVNLALSSSDVSNLIPRDAELAWRH